MFSLVLKFVNDKNLCELLSISILHKKIEHKPKKKLKNIFLIIYLNVSLKFLKLLAKSFIKKRERRI